VSDDFDQGRKVGKYEILARVSVGGMAELYLAFLPGPGGFRKFVALKQILPDVRRDPEFVKMFLDEARITAALSHPNIGQVFDLGVDDASGELYLAMEFIAGLDLASVMRQCARLGVRMPVPVACRIARDVSLGLHAAHTFADPSGRSQPIIHRDVSPKNVMISWAGHVKLIDFGIARARGRLVRTQTGRVKGTLAYMAPEQVLEQPVDGRADLWAVGVILHELLTGTRLVTGSAADLAAIILERPVPPLPESLDVSPALRAVVSKALARDPTARYENGRALGRALEEACPRLADEEEVAGFLATHFARQQEASRALFDAARGTTGQHRALVGLVEGLAGAEPAGVAVTAPGEALPPASPVTGEQPPAVTAPSPEVSQSFVAPLVAAALERAPRRVALIAGVAIAAAIGIGVAVDLSEPALQTGAASVIEPVPVPPLTQKDATALMQRAEQALARGEFQAASALFERVLTVAPEDWHALHGAGVADLKRGQIAEARARLERATEAAVSAGVTGEALALGWYDLACARAREGDDGPALDALERAVAAGYERLRLATDGEFGRYRGTPRFVALVGGAVSKQERDAPAPAALPVQNPAVFAVYAQLVTAMARGDEAGARVLADRCVEAAPRYYACLRVKGELHARAAARTRSRVEREAARRAYEQYESFAPAGDPHRDEVRDYLRRWR
jgi:serine/threonine-protein kinase